MNRRNGWEREWSRIQRDREIGEQGGGREGQSLYGCLYATSMFASIGSFSLWAT